jgi:FkbM family methyltransferase
MTTHQLKKYLRRLLPMPIFESIQTFRRFFHSPSPEVGSFRNRHYSYQPSATDEITLRPGLTLRINPESRTPFEWFCFRSPNMVRELDYFISHLNSYSSFVDVGANHGIFSLVFCADRPDGRVLAVDPSPVAFDILNRNRDLNGFDQMQTRKAACGAARGEVRMKRNWHHLEAVGPEDASADTELVGVLPLDEICAECNVTPELIKIDVEGFELPVLEGATRVLDTAKLLFLEVHPERIDELGLSHGAIFDLLTNSGWFGFTLEDIPLTGADFVDQIHTFWTVWRKEHAAA